MKNWILLFLLLFSLSGGEVIAMTFQRQLAIDTIRCDSASTLFADTINSLIRKAEYREAFFILDHWQEDCGENEINSRTSILLSMALGVHQDDAARQYFNNDFHFVFRYRMEYSEMDDYQYNFWNHATYFNLVPLRHPLDSALMGLAGRLYDKSSLLPNEKLVCRLFMGDLRQFDKEVKKKGNSNTFISQYVKDDKRYISKQFLGVQFFSGIYASNDQGRFLGNNASIGMGLYSPLKYRWQGNLQSRFRIMTHDNEFVFKALGNEYTVNSKLAFDFNINFMYRYFENNHIAILPKAGIGLEYIGTGIKFYDEETEEPSSYNVSTMHTNIGVMALIPVFLRNYAGIEVSYHYCPYGWSKGLISKFNNQAFTVELQFRF
ncbi:MAG: hypothetical protein UZ08_BCD001000337 [Candidatus Parvibacillus calidus]|nr:MAG: hypothetical protein UZ08_BCD001000337 [Candidatus Parvibacillus calidus]